MLRAIGLCDSLAKAVSLSRRIGRVTGVDLEILVCKNSEKPGRFLLRMGRDVLRLGPRGLLDAARLWQRGRLTIRLGSVHAEPTLALIRSRRADVGLHAMSVIYRPSLLSAFRLGVLNAHIGILPRFRGRSVVEWSLLEGRPTGVTTFFIDEGIDTGEQIVLREEIDVSTVGSLERARSYLFSLDSEMYARALERLQEPAYEPIRQQLQEGQRYYVMSSLLRQVAAALLRPLGADQNW